MKLRAGRARAGHARSWWLMLSVLLLAGLGSFTVEPTHADGPVPAAAYATTLAHAEQLAGQAATQPDAARRQALCREAADALDVIRSITLDSGETLPVDNQSLIATLRQPEPEQASARSAQTRLSALRAGVAAAGNRVDPADRQVLKDVLGQPPFTQPAADDWLANLIDDILSRLFGGTARVIYDTSPIIVAIGILLAGVVLGYFAWVLRRAGASEAALPMQDADGEPIQSAGEAFSGAQRYIAAGDYRTAVRLLYLGTLLHLDERGLLRYDRSLTNREYLRAVAAAPSVRDALQPVVETFDRTWYGFGPISAGEFAQYQAQVETLRNAHQP